MCLSPVLIPNPNYNSPIRDPTYRFIHDCESTKLAVPCGRCPVCIYLRQIYLVQRVQMESLDNDLFFGTLTYNNESLPLAEYGDIRFAYPDFSDWQKMLKRIRQAYPDLKFKYLLVQEYGSKRHRPHYHFILSLPRLGNPTLAEKMSTAYRLFDIFLKQWKRNYGSDRCPVWRPLLTYYRRNGKYNYDLHYLDPNSSKDGLDGVAFYVTKYILKYDKWVDRFKSKLYFSLSNEDFKDAWNKLRPRVLMSKGFGSPDSFNVQSHIFKGINMALDDRRAFYPYYFSRVNGKCFPLAPYYSKRFVTPDIQAVFVSRRPDDEDNIDKKIKSVDNFEKVKVFLNSQISEFDYDEIGDINIDKIPVEYETKMTPRFTADDFSIMDFFGEFP